MYCYIFMKGFRSSTRCGHSDRRADVNSEAGFNSRPKREAAPGPSDCAPLLSVADVTLQYKTRDLLVTATQRVSFDVYPADRFVLLGPSGCGKSSLLKSVAGFIKPIQG